MTLAIVFRHRQTKIGFQLCILSRFGLTSTMCVTVCYDLTMNNSSLYAFVCLLMEILENLTSAVLFVNDTADIWM
jgi:hypothetical protein